MIFAPPAKTRMVEPFQGLDRDEQGATIVPFSLARRSENACEGCCRAGFSEVGEPERGFDCA